jgi:small subunit ribosomal protein S5
MVLSGTVTTMGEAIESGLPVREPEIVDILLPETEDEVLDVNMVQRMTDSGRRVNFVITCVVGNKDGFVGLGRARGREVGPSIRRAIDNAKLNVIEVKRGCGSWECGCFRAHSLPFKVVGSSGSVEVSLKPAPQGVGLAVGDVAKSILRLSGITDAWGFTKGHTKTTVNYALAAFDALRKTAGIKVPGELAERLKIRQGAEQVYVHKMSVATSGAAEPPEPTEDGRIEGTDLAEGGEAPKEPEGTEGEPRDEVEKP